MLSEKIMVFDDGFLKNDVLLQSKNELITK